MAIHMTTDPLVDVGSQWCNRLYRTTHRRRLRFLLGNAGPSAVVERTAVIREGGYLHETNNAFVGHDDVGGVGGWGGGTGGDDSGHRQRRDPHWHQVRRFYPR